MGLTLAPPSRLPQALVAELHRRALVEYVRPLLRGRLHCRSARTRSRVAGRLREDAAQLQRLFRRLVSGGPGAGLPLAPWSPSQDSKTTLGGPRGVERGSVTLAQTRAFRLQGL